MKIQGILFAGAMTALVLSATSVQATPIIDGVLDADYGSPTATVTYNPAAPNSNFQAPTNESDAIGYNVYLTSDANYVYGLLQTTGPGTSAGNFANLYFDLDPATGNGSDLGFEITNSSAFVPGMPGSAAVPISFYAGNGSVEFAIANSLFTGPIAGLNYYQNQIFPLNGESITLRLSQSFGYSVAGGATYGTNRLGSVTIGGNAVEDVPEPSSWAMMLIGFGAVGGALRSSRRTTLQRA